MRDNIEELRRHMFEVLEGLKNPDDPMDIERAKAVADVGRVLVESAKVEVNFLKVASDLGEPLKGSGFLTEQPRKPAPLLRVAGDKE